MLRRAMLVVTCVWMLGEAGRPDGPPDGSAALAVAPRQAATPAPPTPTPTAEAPERLGPHGRRWSVYADATRINGMVWASRWRGGEFWAATDGGALRLDDVGNRLRHLTSVDGLPANRVLSVAMDADGASVWFGTAQGLARLGADGRWLRLLDEPEPYQAVDRLLADPGRGDLWIHTTRGLFHRSAAGVLEDLTALRGRWYDEVMGMALDEHSGDLWLAGPRSLTRRSADGAWNRFGAAELTVGLVGDAAITSLAMGPDGQLWLGTSGGQIWHGGVVTGFERAPILPNWETEKDVAVETMAIDDAGQAIWFAGSGLFARADLIDSAKPVVVDGRSVNGRRGTVTAILPVHDSESAHLGTTAGYMSASPRVGGMLVHVGVNIPVDWEAPTASMAQDPRTEATWFVSAPGRLARRDAQGRWGTVSDATRDLPFQTPQVVRDMALAGGQGEVWLATSEGVQVVRGSTGSVTSVDLSRLVPSSVQVRSVATDSRRGTIWLGTDVGAVRIGGNGRMVKIGPESGLPQALVRDIVVDARDGTAWLGTTGGLVRVAPDGTVRVIADDLISGQVLTLAMDSARAELWISTDQGVDVVDAGGRVHHVLRITGDGDRVDSIAIDPATGDRWLGTRGRGLLRQTAAGAWERYGTREGLPDLRVRSLLVAGDELWIATDGGLVRVHGQETDVGGRPPVRKRLSLPWLGAPSP